jgi:hypothetical protein
VPETRALGAIEDEQLEPLCAAAREGRGAYAQASAPAATAVPQILQLAPYVLHETLGPTLPDGLAGAAALWGLPHRRAMQ